MKRWLCSRWWWYNAKSRPNPDELNQLFRMGTYRSHAPMVVELAYVVFRLLRLKDLEVRGGHWTRATQFSDSLSAHRRLSKPLFGASRPRAKLTPI